MDEFGWTRKSAQATRNMVLPRTFKRNILFQSNAINQKISPGNILNGVVQAFMNRAGEIMIRKFLSAMSPYSRIEKEMWRRCCSRNIGLGEIN